MDAREHHRIHEENAGCGTRMNKSRRMVVKTTTAADIPPDVLYGIIFSYFPSCSPVASVDRRSHRNVKLCSGHHLKFESKKWCEQDLGPEAFEMISALKMCRRRYFQYHFPLLGQSRAPNTLQVVRDVLSGSTWSMTICCGGHGCALAVSNCPRMRQKHPRLQYGYMDISRISQRRKRRKRRYGYVEPHED